MRFKNILLAAAMTIGAVSVGYADHDGALNAPPPPADPAAAEAAQRILAEITDAAVARHGLEQMVSYLCAPDRKRLEKFVAERQPELEDDLDHFRRAWNDAHHTDFRIHDPARVFENLRQQIVPASGERSAVGDGAAEPGERPDRKTISYPGNDSAGAADAKPGTTGDEIIAPEDQVMPARGRDSTRSRAKVVETGKEEPSQPPRSGGPKVVETARQPEPDPTRTGGPKIIEVGRDTETQPTSEPPPTEPPATRPAPATNESSEAARVEDGPATTPASEDRRSMQIITLPAAQGAPAVKLLFTREGRGGWRLNIPDSVDADRLRVNLRRRLQDIEEAKDKWPDDLAAAHRFVGQHILAGLVDTAEP